MKSGKLHQRHERLRAEIAHTAARLLVEEEARSYREARRQAVKRLTAGASDERGPHLPDYPEIHTFFSEQLQLYDGAVLRERVRRYRALALEYLHLLAPFHPVLVGSVARGEVRDISDINLQLFCDKPEEVGYLLVDRGIDFEEEGDADWARFYLTEDGIEIECTVLPELERRRSSRCRITGGTLVRLGEKKLREMLGCDQ